MVDVELLPVHRELETRPAEQTFGDALEVKGLVGRIADRPLAFRLRDVFSALGVEIPAAMDLYRRFDLWLVPHRMSVFRERGMAEVTSVGFECKFDPRGRTLCVVEMLPAPAFIRWGAVDAEARCGGVVSVGGAFGKDDAAAEGTGAPQEAETVERAGMRFRAGVRLGVGAHFSCTVTTPYVSAVGIGSDRAQWRFDVHREPLFGRDIPMWMVVALPKAQKTLAYRARLSVTARTAFFPTRRQSGWQELECTLAST